MNENQSTFGDVKGMLGENGNPDDMFIDKKNHIFINKLTYLCKNYDTAFKDVSFVSLS